MIARYILISILKWFVSYLVVGVALAYLIPTTMSDFARNMPVWLLTAAIAFVFATWAFRSKVPGLEDVFTLMGIWLVVMVTLSMGFDILMWGKSLYLSMAWDIKIQYALELAMIVLAAWLSRKKCSKHVQTRG